MVSMPAVVSAEDWQRERDKLLVLETEATRRLGGIAAHRRRLPMVRSRGGAWRCNRAPSPREGV